MALMEWREALEIVLRHAACQGALTSPLGSLEPGAILAESVHADIDSPPFAKALMDGFALHGDQPADPGGWPIAGANLAGAAPLHHLEPGWACHIATGAPLPSGADRVVPREATQIQGSKVIVAKAPPSGAFVAQRGDDFRKGDLLLSPGAILNAGAIAALAAAGRTECLITGAPRVAIVSTGTELVEPSALPTGAQIRNSNGPMLSMAVREAGGVPTYFGLVGDEETTLKEVFAQALEHPMVLATGGVSVGEKDLVRATLESLGVNILVHGVRLKPGKPFLFGVAPHGTIVLGLPGNPTSALANFDLYARAALLKMRGYRNPGPYWARGRLVAPLTVDNNRPTMRPMALEGTHEPFDLVDLSAKGSFESALLARARGWAFLEPGRWEFPAGQTLEVLAPPFLEAMAQNCQHRSTGSVAS